MMRTERLIRSPLLSGIFYPYDADQLRNEIDSLSTYAEQLTEPSQAIISPHGSLLYCGKIIARAWGALAGASPALIVIAGPAHLPYEEGVFLPESTQFDIPGSSLLVDTKIENHLLTQIPSLKKNDLPHLEDHSIEMQLPFAAHYFPGTAILPFLVSGKEPSTVDTAARVLTELQICSGGHNILVMSSDLALSETPEECDALSKEFIASLSMKKTDLFNNLDTSNNSFCGEALIRAFRSAYPEAKATLLDYTNSAAFRQHSDELVVGYGAVGFKG